MDIETIRQHTRDFLPGLLGIRFDAVGPERVSARLDVHTRLCTLPGVLHGGAVMALADTLGAVGTVLNLEAGHGTTTLESKTNFFAAGKEGETVRGTSTPLHRGRRTQVWQTRVCGADDRLLALVTQTQAVLEPRRPAAADPREDPLAVLGRLFEGLDAAGRRTLLAALERAGAGLYRAFAEDEPAGHARAELLRAAEREEENAELLERLQTGAGRASRSS